MIKSKHPLDAVKQVAKAFVQDPGGIATQIRNLLANDPLISTECAEHWLGRCERSP